MTETHYDYIIVGAGSAGCVLAARLTEDPQIRVLLIEAGPKDRSWRIDMPSAVGSLLSSDRFNWNYVSDAEPYLDGRRLTHPRGRVLGGSSSINGMVYIRGHAGDYDGWAESGLSAVIEPLVSNSVQAVGPRKEIEPHGSVMRRREVKPRPPTLTVRSFSPPAPSILRNFCNCPG